MATVTIRLSQERKEVVTHEIELTPAQYRDFKEKIEAATTEDAMKEVNAEFIARMNDNEFPNSVWDSYGEDWEPKAGYYDGMYGDWYDA